MTTTTRRATVLLATLSLGLVAIVRAADTYVELVVDRVPILESTGTKAAVVGYGNRGEIFELSGDTGTFYELHLFSGEARYISKLQAKPANYTPTAPANIGRRQDLFRALERAETHAIIEAHQRTVSIEREVRYRRFLDDRYKLEVVHKFEVQPPDHRLVQTEGAKAQWRRY